MENHLKFLPNQQKYFLKQVSKKSGWSTKKLAKLVNISPRNYRDWKREKINISAGAAKILSYQFNVKLPEKEKTLVTRWKKVRKTASRIGGLACQKKHGCLFTLEQRKKGGKKALFVMRQKGLIPEYKEFNLPKKHNNQLAEFTGILLGDGGLTPWQVHIALNSEADKNYVGFVSSLAKNLFGKKPKIYNHKKIKVIKVYYSGVILIKYLTKIGLKIGNKVKQQVGVPRWIKSSQNCKIACLRGLMDTDGGVFLHKYRVNQKTYIYKKICFTNRSVPLLHFVFTTLKELDLTPKLIDKVENKKVWLYNKNEVEKYLQVVGTHNPRLLKYQ
jgi:transcriptional regulator with XRE-family HTH domain